MRCTPLSFGPCTLPAQYPLSGRPRVRCCFARSSVFPALSTKAAFVKYWLLAVALLSLLPFVVGLIASYRFPGDGTFRGRLRDMMRFLKLALAPRSIPASTLYELWGQHIYTDDTSYINLGYWEDATNLDEAGRALVRLVAQEARLGPSDDVLDIGFGFGEQDVEWLTSFEPKSITGINITEHQIEFARKRAEALGLSDRLKFEWGSATDIPFDGARFSKVVAVECAFHFDPRETFFAEAMRVLKPGGRVVVADLVPSERAGKPGLIARMMEPIRAGLWQIPRANDYPTSQYVARLEAAGFQNVRVVDISQQVFGPLRAFTNAWLQQPQYLERLHWLHRNRLSTWLSVAFLTHDRPFAPFDYIVVMADKPE